MVGEWRRVVLGLWSRARHNHLLLGIPAVFCIVVVVSLSQGGNELQPMEPSTSFADAPPIHDQPADRIVASSTWNEKIGEPYENAFDIDNNVKEDIEESTPEMTTGEDTLTEATEDETITEETNGDENSVKQTPENDEEKESEMDLIDQPDDANSTTSENATVMIADTTHIGKMTLDTILSANPTLAAAIKQAEAALSDSQRAVIRKEVEMEEKGRETTGEETTSPRNEFAATSEAPSTEGATTASVPSTAATSPAGAQRRDEAAIMAAGTPNGIPLTEAVVERTEGTGERKIPSVYLEEDHESELADIAREMSATQHHKGNYIPIHIEDMPEGA